MQALIKYLPKQTSVATTRQVNKEPWSRNCAEAELQHIVFVCKIVSFVYLKGLRKDPLMFADNLELLVKSLLPFDTIIARTNSCRSGTNSEKYALWTFL